MVAKLESSIASPTTPKMLNEVALGEFMVHGEDIRRALGDRGEHPSEHVSAIGEMYATGLGVPQSNTLAYMWYHIYIANGSIDGARGRKRVADRMTPEDISAAQATARSCVQSKYQACQ